MNRQLLIAASLLVTILGSAGFIAAYATGGSRLWEGLGIALGAAGLSAAALGWAFWIVPAEVVVDEIETYPSAADERAAETGEVAEDLRKIRARVYCSHCWAPPLPRLRPRSSCRFGRSGLRQMKRYSARAGATVRASCATMAGP